MTTLEAAIIVPLVICLLCVFVLGILQIFQAACTELITIRQESETVVRQPAAVIRNTDLILSYLERIQDAWEEGE